jgi:hypothetical protein
MRAPRGPGVLALVILVVPSVTGQIRIAQRRQFARRCVAPGRHGRTPVAERPGGLILPDRVLRPRGPSVDDAVQNGPYRVVRDVAATPRAHIRADVSEDVVMKMGGWPTRAMLTRYNIVDTADVAAAQAELMRPSRPRATGRWSRCASPDHETDHELGGCLRLRGSGAARAECRNSSTVRQPSLRPRARSPRTAGSRVRRSARARTT